MKRVMSAILCVALGAGASFAQGEPGFGGLQNANREDLAALVQQLLKRVAELERRVDALEGGQALTSSGEGAPRADPEAARLLAAAIAEKEKLAKRLDGFTREDPRDARIQYSRVKASENWDAAVADARRFADALKAVVGRASGVGAAGKSSLEGLIKWARGRSIFQVKRVLNAQEHLILPLDFGTDVVPHDTR